MALNLTLDEDFVELLSLDADPLTRLQLHQSDKLTAPVLEALLEIGNKGELQQNIDHAFETGASVELVAKHYSAIKEVGIEFSESQVECMAGEVVGQRNKKADTELLRDYVAYCKERGETEQVYRAFNQSFVGEGDLTLLEGLDDTTLISYLHRMIKEWNQTHTAVRDVASLVEQKELLEDVVRKYLHLEHFACRFPSLMCIAEVTGNYEDIETHVDQNEEISGKVKYYPILYGKTESPTTRQKLEDIACQAINAENCWLATNKWYVYREISELIKLNPERVIKEVDILARKILVELREGGSEEPKRTLFRGAGDEVPLRLFYSQVGMSCTQASERLGNIAMEAGMFKEALECYRCLGDNEWMYKKGLRLAEKRQYKWAFELFQGAHLEKVQTNDRLFYETIAQTILPVLLNGIDPELVKRKVNSKIKSNIIRDITVLDNSFTIDFGAGEYTLTIRKKEVVSRNDLHDYVHGYVERDTVKEYKTRKELEVDKFWTEFLQDKAPVKRVLGTRGNLLQIETSPGIPFLAIADQLTREELRDYLMKASAVAFGIYEVLQRHNPQGELTKELERRGMDYRLDKAHINERFERFLSTLDNPILRAKVREIQPDVTECLLTCGDGAIIDNDFAARNLMVEDGEIVVVDHENYRQGHPLQQIVSLVTSPYQHDMGDVLVEQARGYEVDNSFLPYATLLWSMRQAAFIASWDKGTPEAYDFFVGKIEEVLV